MRLNITVDDREIIEQIQTRIASDVYSMECESDEEDDLDEDDDTDIE